MMGSFVLLLMVGLSLSAVAQKSRVVDHKLSDKEPGSPDYDHEAFLGKDEAAEFKDLSPEESKRRLGIIIDKVDKNADGKVTEQELKDWLHQVQVNYISGDSDKQFEHYDTNNDKKLTWDEYKKTAYGYLDSEESKTDEHQRMITRDERRFKKADVDKDNSCSVEEFRSFMHPEEFDHMKEIVVQETIDEIDKNKDGVIDIDEYIGDMHHDDETGTEPDWVSEERKQFKDFRDTDKDGKLNLEEVRNWLIPTDSNHIEQETEHLFSVADDDKDKALSKEEIINHHDTFVDSQFTDWGEALKRHDEF